MTPLHSDALVFFGATGDLAYKKIFPALQAMIKRGHLDIPGDRRGQGGLESRSASRPRTGTVSRSTAVIDARRSKLSKLLRYVARRLRRSLYLSMHSVRNSARPRDRPTILPFRRAVPDRS